MQSKAWAGKQDKAREGQEWQRKTRSGRNSRQGNRVVSKIRPRGCRQGRAEEGRASQLQGSKGKARAGKKGGRQVKVENE